MKKLALASILMSSSILLSRVIGFIRDAIIAANFGSGAMTDAYYASFTLPDFLNYLVAGGAFSLTFIPIFVHYLVNKEEDKGWKLYSIIISTMSIILIIAIIILEFMAPTIVKSMFPGFSGKLLDDTILFTRIVLPAQLFFYNGGIIAAILMAKKRFLMPALAPLVYNISIIIFGLLFSKYGIIGFSVGALLGSFLGPFLIQFLALRKEINFKLNFNFLDKDFLNFLKISIPIMAGLILISLDDWISKFYGSKLPDGTITYLNNSRRLIMVPIGVFAQANAQAILPFLSEFFSKKEFEKFNQLIRKSTTLVFFITSFAASWYIVFHNEIIRMVYQRGKFLEVNSIENSKIFLMFAFAVPFWAGVTIVSRFYYSMKNTLIPMIIGAVMLILSIPLFIILPKYMGASGLALTISITKFLYFITIFFVFKKVFKEFEIKVLFLDIAKIMIFFIVITSSFFFIKRYIKINWFVLLAVGSSIQFVVTLFLAKFLKLDAYQEFFNRYLLRIIRKIKR